MPNTPAAAANMLSAWVAAADADAARRQADAANAKPTLEYFDPFPDPPSGPPGLWSELKRREVFQSIALYALLAAGVLQALYLIIPALGLAGWLWLASLIAALVGLPITVIIGWRYDLTPDGVRLDEGPYHRGILPTPRRWPRLLAVVGIALVLALVSLAMWLRLTGSA